METKFTKGNWFIKESNFENTDIICQTVLMTDLKFNDLRTPIICDLYGQATEEGQATAKLLCAAPDLFEACVNAFKTLSSIGCTMESEIMQELSKAIEKATK